MPQQKTMTTQRQKTAGIAATGVHHVAKVVSQANCVFQTVDQQNDIGIDGFIELIVDERATGCCIAVQVKSGSSYCGNGDWHIPADSKHVAYWKSHLLPVCGIVFDPDSDTARWADITAVVQNCDPSKGISIAVPISNQFTASSFSKFAAHFLEYREGLSVAAHFGKTLEDLSKIDDAFKCGTAMRSLFSFHRNNSAAWHYIILTLPELKNAALIRHAAITLSHIPGHGDIFWHSRNIICEETRREALDIIKTRLGRDGIVALLNAIVQGEGIGRGTVGQCVHAIVSLAPDIDAMLKSIILDQAIDEMSRYWAVLIYIDIMQSKDWRIVADTLQIAKNVFTEDCLDSMESFCEQLRLHHFIDLW